MKSKWEGKISQPQACSQAGLFLGRYIPKYFILSVAMVNGISNELDVEKSLA